MKHILELQVFCAGRPAGMLALRQKQYWFQYEANWLQQGFDLAPRMMAFNHVPQIAKLPVFQGLQGVFYDSLPDGWGLLLMDRFFKRQFGWENYEVTPLDRLAYLGRRAMGALEYEPTLSDDSFNEKINLATLTEEAAKVLEGKTHAVLNQLRILGGSPGGARPKVTLAFSKDFHQAVSGISELPADFSHWLVKFRGFLDTADMGRIEKTYMDIAKHAGIRVPESKLIEVKHKDRTRELLFAVKRFDREGDIKRHMITLSGYLYADFRLPSLDYSALLATTAILTQDQSEVEHAFRLMVFNIAMHNKDDHAKNFAFIADQKGKWQLTPAYDLTFSSGMNNEHTTAINGAGNPGMRDIETLAKAHAIVGWEEIVKEVLHATSGWRALAGKNKVTKNSIEKIAKALCNIKI